MSTLARSKEEVTGPSKKRKIVILDITVRRTNLFKGKRPQVGGGKGSYVERVFSECKKIVKPPGKGSLERRTAKKGTGRLLTQFQLKNKAGPIPQEEGKGMGLYEAGLV